MHVMIAIGRRCRGKITLIVDQDVNTLIDEYSRIWDIIIYSDASVVG